jgi:hypothetical protein
MVQTERVIAPADAEPESRRACDEWPAKMEFALACALRLRESLQSQGEIMTDGQWKPGDIVRVKSGGPDMTVAGDDAKG